MDHVSQSLCLKFQAVAGYGDDYCECLCLAQIVSNCKIEGMYFTLQMYTDVSAMVTLEPVDTRAADYPTPHSAETAVLTGGHVD